MEEVVQADLVHVEVATEVEEPQFEPAQVDDTALLSRLGVAVVEMEEVVQADPVYVEDALAVIVADIVAEIIIEELQFDPDHAMIDAEIDVLQVEPLHCENVLLFTLVEDAETETEELHSDPVHNELVKVEDVDINVVGLETVAVDTGEIL